MKLLFQRTPARPVTQLNLVFPRSGACLDDPALRGLTRLTLRQMLMGAGGMSNDELNGRLERLGASTGFSLNNDHFTLRLLTLTENLDAALELFLLSINRPHFEREEFTQLQSELVSGWLAERDESKQTRAREVYLNRIYEGRALGFQSDGLAEGLRSIPPERPPAHYQMLFSGPPPFAAALSDLPREAIESRLLPRLALPAPTGGNGAHPWDDFTPPERTGRRVTIVADEQTQTDEMVMGYFAAHRGDPDWHLHRLISLIFGGDMNSRLFRVVRGERGLSYGASCWYEANAGHGPVNRSAPFTFYSFPSVEHSAEAAPLLISLYEALVSDGITEAELTLARSALINSHPFTADTPEKILGTEILKALYGVDIDDEPENRRKLEAVTRAEVRRALEKTHHPQALEIVLLGDPGRLEPIAAQIPNVDKVATIRYP